ncbi:MAG TPA: hypothetical protein DEP23_09470 [Ruminococcaceae bacterium]|nr:hypothetical protein [Oscillospiraceae bacterium]
MSDKELQSVMERTGYKIPPYRLACISKTASKIVQMLTNPSPIMLTANETNITLDMVRFILERGENG